MSERPILFSVPMVRAILEGTKTQTRRIVKGTALEWLAPDMFTPEYVADPGNFFSPYGYDGDRLWVRENWHPCDSGPVLYAADYESKEQAGVSRWYPSIHLRRVDARIVLEVLAVRIERLQAITEDDARAEGAELARVQCARDPSRGPIVDGFANLWNAINGKRATWSSNPWVWVVEFERRAP